MDHRRVDCAVRRIIVAVGYLSRGKSSGGTIAGMGCRAQIYIYIGKVETDRNIASPTPLLRTPPWTTRQLTAHPRGVYVGVIQKL